MKSNLLSKIKLFDRTQANKSWQTYGLILRTLCEDHPDQTWAKSIPGYLRSGQIGPLLDLADSLAAQNSMHTAAKDCFLANQIAAVIRKYPFPKHLVDIDPEAKAKETWIDNEIKVSFVNSRFEYPFWGSLWKEYEKMRGFINYVLSPVLDLQQVYDSCDVGPGASIGVHGKATNLARKFGSNWTVTPGAHDYAYNAICRNFHAVELLNPRESPIVCLDPVELKSSFKDRVRIVTHNKITFVPKTARTLRSIAVEPFLNTFLQKGVDNVMRRKLRRVGINLTDQGINSEMARKGSLSDTEDSFVTIDLRNASDSIATNLCKQLLPQEWFDFLNRIRSLEYELDGKLYTYHKFCSMGNGFCFPLETLLFTAACIAVGAGIPSVDFHVYGDDIVLRKRHADALILLLQDMGFELNSEKSFLNGQFRESCGSDWFGGDNVRPMTLDFELNSLQSLIKFVNLSQRNTRTFVFFEGAREVIYSLIPRPLHFYRPVAGPADSAMTVEKDRFLSSPHSWWSKDYQAWGWKEILNLPVPDRGWKDLPKSNVLLVMAALRGSSSKLPFALRRMTRKAVRKVSYSSDPTGFGRDVVETKHHIQPFTHA